MNMRFHFPNPGLTGLLLALLLGGCASQVPLAIREAPADSPSLALVRGDDTAGYQGQQVRFGGTIIETVNETDTTRLTVLGRPLSRDGEPTLSDDSSGRFIAVVPEFLDPKVYAADRDITVTGTLLGSEAGKVGEYDYSYPVVEATAWYLWPRETLPPYRYNPWYDPWYDPFYGPWYYRPWYDPWRRHRYPYRYWP